MSKNKYPIEQFLPVNKKEHLQNVQEKVRGSNPNCPQVCVNGSVSVPKIRIQTKPIMTGTVN